MPDPATPLLLALHSCTERFGVAVHGTDATHPGPHVAVFDDGRGLSNSLIERVDALLPRSRWSQLQGIAVATGPGGFTGTRLSVVMARTLAQQLGCPLLGISSFALMAQRLHTGDQPFWITQLLPRRGVVAGQYSVSAEGVTELRTPHLLEDGQVVTPSISESPNVEADVACLLTVLQQRLAHGDAMPWQPVLPIYPTSPVGPV